jgi:transcriptional regulator with XRE-family HTH domain
MQAKSIAPLWPSYDDGMKAGRPPKSERTDFAARLAMRREAAGLSQRQVAAALGISQPSYALWEQRNVAITAEQLIKLANILHTPVEDLLYDGIQPARNNGPTGKVRQVFEKVNRLPRHQQSKVVEFVEAFVNQKIAAH